VGRKKAIQQCGQDELLVLGYLKYNGCAVVIKDMSYKEWVLKMAQKHKADYLVAQRGKMC